MPRFDTIEFLRRLPKLPKGIGLNPLSGRLSETDEFGNNPGQLRMLSFVPDALTPDAPLVVVLHGCTQSAQAYDTGSGWSALADRYGFALLYPEQQRSNNPNLCFNWFNPEDTSRGNGEARSIRMMIETMVRTHGLDPRRVFVTGLSAGGAMASVMLATYPDVFAGGAIIAGLPYGVAGNLRTALSAMSNSTALSAPELGSLVRKASPHRGAWPRISVWHGDADRTVNPGNANEIVKQWLDVHGLPLAPMSSNDIDGHVHEQWWDREGHTVVESYTVRAMAHGTPLAIEGETDSYGAAGPFMLEAGIASSVHIAAFFGLTDAVARRAAPEAKPQPFAQPVIDLMPLPKPERPKSPKALDVGDVINRALSAAGLLK